MQAIVSIINTNISLKLYIRGTMSTQKDKYYMIKYGITLAERDQIIRNQDYKCACCGELFGQKRIYIDHKHEIGYLKMEAKQKKLFIRAAVCFICNKFLIAKNTLKTIDMVYDYLQKYEKK